MVELCRLITDQNYPLSIVSCIPGAGTVSVPLSTPQQRRRRPNSNALVRYRELATGTVTVRRISPAQTRVSTSVAIWRLTESHSSGSKTRRVHLLKVYTKEGIWFSDCSTRYRDRGVFACGRKRSTMPSDESCKGYRRPKTRSRLPSSHRSRFSV